MNQPTIPEEKNVLAERKTLALEGAATLEGQVPKSSATTPRLELRGLVKAYRDLRVVRGVDLIVEKGEFLTILGPSGSGKTTILRIVAGFMAPSEGRVLIDGQDVVGLPPAARGLGIVLQHYALFPHMTVAQNVEYGLRMRRWSRQRRAERVAEMTEIVGLGGMERRFPRELSGGQQQRVALARALAFDPMLLLMDEPLGALDRELRIRMAGELRRIHRELGTTIVYVTHDREEALTMSDRVAIMHDGSLEAVGSPADLYLRPHTPFVARFFGGHNLLPARVIDMDPAGDQGERLARAECAGQVVHVRTWREPDAADPAHLAIAPGAVTIGSEHGPGELCLSATVADVVYLGELIQVTCELEDGTKVQAQMPVESGSSVSLGAQVVARIEGRRVVLV